MMILPGRRNACKEIKKQNVQAQQDDDLTEQENACKRFKKQMYK